MAVCSGAVDITAFYPDLADAKIETAWAGLMPYLRHKMPSFGALSPGVWYAAGFAAWAWC